MRDQAGDAMMFPILIILMVLVTTARHEGAHALAAWLQGIEVNDVQLLPGIHPELGFYFGYVSHGDGGTWWIDFAPFIAAVLWLASGFAWATRLPRTHAMFLPVFLLGVVSPLADLAYNYAGGLWRPGTDVHDLFLALPNGFVHLYFFLAIGMAVMALRTLHRRPA